MIRTIADVIDGEGLPSALRRANERATDAAASAASRVCGWLVRDDSAPLLNVAPGGIAPRKGGVAVQLATRLRAERSLRRVALLTPGALHAGAHSRRMPHDLTRAIDEALRRTGATTVHVEGLAGLQLADLRRLMSSGVRAIVSIHDFSLFSERPNLLEEPHGAFCGYSTDAARCSRCLGTTRTNEQRRADARALLQEAAAVVFPSSFLLEQHRQLFSLPLSNARVIEPAAPGSPLAEPPAPLTQVAFAGSVQRHKGSALLPALAKHLHARGKRLHVLGGGDADILRQLRKEPNVVVHGYYRAGTLPRRLRNLQAGLGLLPSIVPESFSLTLSEVWMAGASALAFDHGAIGQRIARAGGGWTVPLAGGVAALCDRIDAWLDGSRVPRNASELPSPAAVATAHLALYRELDRGLTQ